MSKTRRGKAIKHEAGLMIFSTPDADSPTLEVPTVQCCHCGCHFPHPRFDSTPEAKASRIGRGYCKRCDAYICGAGCMTCVHVEQLLENIEAGRELEFAPTVSKPFTTEPTGKIWVPGEA